jgi:hypothetical protein
MTHDDSTVPKRPADVSLNPDPAAQPERERFEAELRRGAELSASLVAEWGDLAAALREGLAREIAWINAYYDRARGPARRVPGHLSRHAECAP